jgi:hypothetical protein
MGRWTKEDYMADWEKRIEQMRTMTLELKRYMRYKIFIIKNV